MPPPDARPGGIEVAGQLAILADDHPLHVEFAGDAVVVVFPDLRSALRLRRSFARGQRRALWESLRSTLARTGLELRVQVRDHEVGRLASTSRRNWLASWLGVDPLELKSRAILAALVGREPPASDPRQM